MTPSVVRNVARGMPASSELLSAEVGDSWLRVVEDVVARDSGEHRAEAHGLPVAQVEVDPVGLANAEIALRQIQEVADRRHRRESVEERHGVGDRRAQLRRRRIADDPRGKGRIGEQQRAQPRRRADHVVILDVVEGDARAQVRREPGSQIDAERPGARGFGFQVRVAPEQQDGVDLGRASRRIADAESVHQRGGGVIGADGRAEVAKARRAERTPVAAAEIHPVDRFPGKADLRIGRGAEVAVMIVAARQRQREAPCAIAAALPSPKIGTNSSP